MLKEKNILLGVTGSIAAYKAAILVRLLIKEGAHVKVIMTDAAMEFIAPLTLATLSRNPVLSQFVSKEQGEWSNHVELGRWADLMLIAPATINTLAKMAHGICDNLLLATYYSFPAREKPMCFAPAMDFEMYQQPANRENINKLQSYGNILILPDSGELASGLHGHGRMTEPEVIINTIKGHLRSNLPLLDKKILITAGPTHEAIDAVRFISNRSSGKMGFALAEAAANLGAQVTLVTGPVSLATPNDVNRIDVTTAKEMYQHCVKEFPSADITIMTAAVADYSPKTAASYKLKTQTTAMSLRLSPTPDILAELGGIKTDKQLLVGFALETDDELKHATTKLKKKNLDYIVLNSLKDEGAGFDHDTNKVTLIDKENTITEMDLKSKKEVAKDILSMLLMER